MDNVPLPIEASLPPCLSCVRLIAHGMPGGLFKTQRSMNFLVASYNIYLDHSHPPIFSNSSQTYLHLHKQLPISSSLRNQKTEMKPNLCCPGPRERVATHCRVLCLPGAHHQRKHPFLLQEAITVKAPQPSMTECWPVLS